MISNTKICEGMGFQNSRINYVVVLDESKKNKTIWCDLKKKKKKLRYRLNHSKLLSLSSWLELSFNS